MMDVKNRLYGLLAGAALVISLGAFGYNPKLPESTSLQQQLPWVPPQHITRIGQLLAAHTDYAALRTSAVKIAVGAPCGGCGPKGDRNNLGGGSTGGGGAWKDPNLCGACSLNGAGPGGLNGITGQRNPPAGIDGNDGHYSDDSNGGTSVGGNDACGCESGEPW